MRDGYFIQKPKGFTLIELLVVVLIIGILASIAVPQYKMAVHKARINSYMPTLRALADAEEMHYLSTGSYASLSQKDELDVAFPEECQPIPGDNSFSCSNHISLKTFSYNNSDTRFLGVGMTYCYNSATPCTNSTCDLRIVKMADHLPEDHPMKANEGQWGCTARSLTDTFGKKICQAQFNYRQNEPAS